MKLTITIVIIITVTFLVITESFRKGGRRKGSSDVEEERKAQIGKKKNNHLTKKTLKRKKKPVKKKKDAKKNSRRKKKQTKNRRMSKINKKKIKTKKKKQYKNLDRKINTKKKHKKNLKNNKNNKNNKKRTNRKKQSKGGKAPLNGKRKKQNGKLKKRKNRRRKGNGHFKVNKSEIIKTTRETKHNSFILEGRKGVTKIYTTIAAEAIVELNIGFCFSYSLNCFAIDENTCLSGRDDRFYTASGKLCINWEEGGFENMLLEFEGSPDHNRCMNATNGPYKEGPWCYTSKEGAWEKCYMACTCLLQPPSTVGKLVNKNTYVFETAKSYTYEKLDQVFYKNVTNLRQKCIPWYDDYGQPNNRQHPPHEVFHNRCLNPDNDNGGPYCYYGIGRSKWEFCYKSCEQPVVLKIISAEQNAGALTLPYNSDGKLSAAVVKTGQLLIIKSSINAGLTIVGERGDLFSMSEFVKLQFSNDEESIFVNGESVPSSVLLTYTNVNQTNGVAVYIAVYSKMILLFSVTRSVDVGFHVTVKKIDRCPNDGDTAFAFTVGGHHPYANVRLFPGVTEDTILPFRGYFNKHDAPRSQIGTVIFTLFLLAGRKGNFRIELYDESNIALRFDVRFNEHNIFVNDYHHGQWGVETTTAEFPFAYENTGVYEIAFELNKGKVTVLVDDTFVDYRATRAPKFISYYIEHGRGAEPNAVHILSIFNPNNL